MTVEQFKAEIEQLWHTAKQDLIRDGATGNWLVVWDGAGQRKLVRGINPLGGGKQLAPVITPILKELRGVAFILVVEAWARTTPEVRPSLDPAREEALILTAIHPSYREMRSLRFDRDDCGDVHFGIERRESGDDLREFPIAHLLDEEPAAYEPWALRK